MARKLTSNTTVGRPGFKVTSINRYTGALVSKTRAAKRGVRRLIARDPANGISANIGTKRDILGFTNDPSVPNTTPASNPTILSDSKVRRAGSPSGQKRVADRSTNRSIKRS